MTLQNRIDPWGQIVATPERGTMMGNRGGKFHLEDKTLGKRRWASRHWICCELRYKGRHHEAMGDAYTSLFFLDEVTALAAGHRPCFFCRRVEAKAFLGDGKVAEFDRDLHAERLAPRSEGAVEWLPDGAMHDIDGQAFAVKGRFLLRWTFGGYTEKIQRTASMRGRLLTAPSITAILRAGYEPRWHPSAEQGDGT